MASTSEYERAKAYLESKTGDKSLYDHLSELILYLISEQPKSGLAAFEHISALVKTGSYPSAAAPTVAAAAGTPAHAEATAAALARVTAELALLAPVDEDETPGEGVQNITEEAAMLEWAGIGLGREAAFRLHASLRRLAANTGAQQVRLWGKLLGTQQDYWVAEGRLEEVPEDAEEIEDGAKDSSGNVIEPFGTGLNKFTYWVANAPGGKWTQLPLVKPAQVLAIRTTRRYLTGDPAAPVAGHPPFPGREAEYVRALIAVISAATVLSPAGVYKQEEEEEAFDVVLNEDEEAPFEPVDLTDASNWVHHALPINSQGRVQPNPAEIGEDGEEIEDPDAPEPGTLLAAAADDMLELDGEDEPLPLWALRTCPTAGPPLPEDLTSVMVAAKSLAWPGAVAVGLGARFVNCYVGWGVPGSVGPQAAYEPTLPAALPAEYATGAGAQDDEEAEEEGEQVPLRERADVTVDPNEGKEADEEDEEEEDD